MNTHQLHLCERIYNNGDRIAVKEYYHPNEPYLGMEGWVADNSFYRFGCALFVDGICVHYGYLGRARCEAIERGANPKDTLCGAH